MKQQVSERKSSRSNAPSRAPSRQLARTSEELAICIKNEGYEASLELRKIYRVIEDVDAKAHRLIRVVDESGEDYLYPKTNFLPIILPPTTRRAVLAAA